MAAPLIIRKYKNRRLYDTEQSRHVTRDELLALIRAGRDVRIEAAGTGEDVTAETILQMLLAEDGVASSVFTSEFVHFLVRTEAGMLGRFFREVLPTAMRSFQVAASPMVEAQTRARQQVQQMAAAMPGFAAPWAMNPWAAFGGAPPPAPPQEPEPEPEPAPEPGATGAEEAQAAFAALQAQMASLQAKLAAMERVAEEEPEEPAPPTPRAGRKKAPAKKKKAFKKKPSKKKAARSKKAPRRRK